ncbi:hypothetical protein CAPI_06760 [Corynebacterium capitovis DSM 44611]|uniref:hypothetical protein n=1 Tax=Corynebacterium capitovis TaxID=131081 RepID=UPI00036B0D9F|nr:hypothetical protein [Corynebacterium capitovis]WKD57892.1 hypothetical protein CAPI_06760 [Corynebacterium capitovis DSM 44611]
MSEPVVRDDFSRGEVVSGLTWLSIGAAISGLLEVVYCGVVAAIIGALFNSVLSKTAMLWVGKNAAALIPWAVWVLVLGLLFFVPAAGGFVAPTNNILRASLIVAGSAGAIWPLTRAK